MLHLAMLKNARRQKNVTRDCFQSLLGLGSETAQALAQKDSGCGLHHVYVALVWHWALASLSHCTPHPHPPCVFGSWLGAQGLRTVLKQTRRCPQPWKSGSDLKESNKSRSAALYCWVLTLLSPSFTFSVPFLFDIYFILCPYCCFTFLRRLFANLCLYPFSVVTGKGYRFWQTTMMSH